MYFKSLFVHFLGLSNGLIILAWGNLYLNDENWVLFSEVQYTIALLTAICWLGTDIDGIRRVRKSLSSGHDKEITLEVLALRFCMATLLCPLIYLFNNPNIATIITVTVYANLLYPVFYIYAKTQLFNIFVKLEVLQKSFITMTLIYSIYKQQSYMFVLTCMMAIQCVSSIVLLYSININPFSKRKNYQINFKSLLKRDSFTFFAMQITQQLLYALPVIVMSKFDYYEWASNYTNAERIIRQLRAVAGNILKVALGKTANNFQREKKIFRYFVIFFTLSWITIVVAKISYPMQMSYVSSTFILLLLVVPIGSFRTYIIGIRYRDISLPVSCLFVTVFSALTTIIAYGWIIRLQSELFLPVYILVIELTILITLVSKQFGFERVKIIKSKTIR